jgi:kynurenine formamidase
MTTTPEQPDTNNEGLTERKANLENTKSEVKEIKEMLQARMNKASASTEAPTPAATAKAEVSSEVVPEAEWNNFVDNGKVSESRIQSITEKIEAGESLSTQEQAMRTARSEEIEKILGTSVEPAPAAETTPATVGTVAATEPAPTAVKESAATVTEAAPAATEATKAPETPQEKIDAGKKERRDANAELEEAKRTLEKRATIVEEYKTNKKYQDRKTDFETSPEGTAITIIREEIDTNRKKAEKNPENADDYKNDIEKLENKLRALGVAEKDLEPVVVREGAPANLESARNRVERNKTLEAFVEKYNAEYKKNNWLKRGWRTFVHGIGAAENLENKDKWSDELKQAEAEYEAAREAYLDSKWQQIDALAAAKGWDAKKVEDLKQKYRGVEAVAAAESSLNEAREKAFKNWLRSAVNGFRNLDSSVKIGLVGGLIGARVFLTGGTTDAIASVGMGIAGAIGGRKIMEAIHSARKKKFMKSELAQGFLQEYAIGKARAEGGGDDAVKKFRKQAEQMASSPEGLKKLLSIGYDKHYTSFKTYNALMSQIEKRERGRAAARVAAGLVAGGVASSFGDDVAGLFEGKDAASSITDGLDKGDADAGEGDNKADEVPLTPDQNQPAELKPDAEGKILDDHSGLDNIDKDGLAGVEDGATDGYTIDDVDKGAFIQKGEGITHAFMRQLDSDASLVQALERMFEEKGIDLHYEDNKGVFLSRVAQEFGYIDESGADVRVFHGNDAAYDLRLEGNNVIVHEWANGAKIEYHTFGSAFEPTEAGGGIEKTFEYKESGATTPTPEGSSTDVTELNQGLADESQSSVDVTALNQTPTDAGTGSVDVTALNQTPDSGLNPNSVFTPTDSTRAEIAIDPWAQIKATGFNFEDASGNMTTIAYENVANGSARGEVMEANLSNLPQSVADAFVALRTAVLNRGIEPSDLPYSLSVDELTQIAAGSSLDQFMNVPTLNAAQAVDLLEYPTLHPLDAQGLFEYFRVNIGEELGTYFDTPYSDMENVFGEGAAPNETYVQFGGFMNKLVEASGIDLNANPGASIQEIINRSLASMGSGATVESMLTR